MPKHASSIQTSPCVCGDRCCDWWDCRPSLVNFHWFLIQSLLANQDFLKKNAIGKSSWKVVDYATIRVGHIQKKSLKILKWYSEVLKRMRTDNTATKRKRTNIDSTKHSREKLNLRLKYIYIFVLVHFMGFMFSFPLSLEW